MSTSRLDVSEKFVFRVFLQDRFVVLTAIKNANYRDQIFLYGKRNDNSFFVVDGPQSRPHIVAHSGTMRQ